MAIKVVRIFELQSHITYMEKCINDNKAGSIIHEMSDTWDSIWETKRMEDELLNIENDVATPLFKQHLPTTGKILEAGCGLGKWVVYLRKLGYEVIGVDFSSKAIESIKEYDKFVPVQQADVINLPYQDHSFSAYISLGVIEHFIDGPRAVLKEAQRVLKPGGLLFLSIPIQGVMGKAISPLENTMSWIRRNNHLRRLRGKRPLVFFQYLFSPGELTSILNALDFEIFFIKPIYHKEGLLDLDNRLFGILSKIKCENGRLNKAIDKASFYLERISPYLTPFGIILLARAQRS